MTWFTAPLKEAYHEILYGEKEREKKHKRRRQEWMKFRESLKK